jgi:L-lactate dehydrogenase complex protein LldG
MSSREKILENLKAGVDNMSDAGSRMSEVLLPDFDLTYLGDALIKFKTVLGELHSVVIEVESLAEVASFISDKFPKKRIISNVAIEDFAEEKAWKTQDPHDLEDVEFALFEGTLGVAENGAIWLSETQMGQRVAPFICQRLGIILKKSNIIPLMHHAYQTLEITNLGYGTFISGPSKTADIEQSLVIGAHGPRELFVFLV